MNKPFKIFLLKTVSRKSVTEISNIMKQQKPDMNALSIGYLKKLLDNPSVKVFTALNSDRKIIGIITMISYFKTDGIHKVYIEDLAVNSDDRRKGVGAALTKKVLDTAKKNGANTIHLTSNPSRIGANILYKKIGFKIYKTNYYKYNL